MFLCITSDYYTDDFHTQFFIVLEVTSQWAFLPRLLKLCSNCMLYASLTLSLLYVTVLQDFIPNLDLLGPIWTYNCTCTEFGLASVAHFRIPVESTYETLEKRAKSHHVEF